MGSETERTEGLTGRTCGRATGDWRATKAKCFTAKGVGTGSGVAHDDVSVTFTFPVANVTFSYIAISVEFTLAVESDFTFPLAGIAVAVTT